MTIKKHYKGILTKPIPLCLPAEYDYAVSERIKALYEHFDLEPSEDHRKLLLALAENHITGFQRSNKIPTKVGQPSQLIGYSRRGLRLYALVQKYKNYSGVKTLAEALKLVIANEKEFQKVKPQSLRQNYEQAKKNELVKEIKLACKSAGFSEEETTAELLKQMNYHSCIAKVRDGSYNVSDLHKMTDNEKDKAKQEIQHAFQNAIGLRLE